MDEEHEVYGGEIPEEEDMEALRDEEMDAHHERGGVEKASADDFAAQVFLFFLLTSLPFCLCKSGTVQLLFFMN